MSLPGAEGPLAGAGEDDDPHLRIGGEVVEGGRKALPGREGKRVAVVRAIDDHPCHVSGALHEDLLGVVHGVFQFSEPLEASSGVRSLHSSQVFRYQRIPASIAAEAALDGLYVVRTSVPELDAHATVRAYKRLSTVERAFRSLDTVNLKVRPVFHRTPERVRAHVLLCMLAYYVEWHMRQRLRPLLFDDEDHEGAEADRPSSGAGPGVAQCPEQGPDQAHGRGRPGAQLPQPARPPRHRHP